MLAHRRMYHQRAGRGRGRCRTVARRGDDSRRRLIRSVSTTSVSSIASVDGTTTAVPALSTALTNRGRVHRGRRRIRSAVRQRLAAGLSHLRGRPVSFGVASATVRRCRHVPPHRSRPARTARRRDLGPRGRSAFVICTGASRLDPSAPIPATQRGYRPPIRSRGRGQCRERIGGPKVVDSAVPRASEAVRSFSTGASSGTRSSSSNTTTLSVSENGSMRAAQSSASIGPGPPRVWSVRAVTGA